MRMQRSGAILATGVLAVAGALALGGQASAGTDLQHPYRVVAATLVAPSVVAPSIHHEIFGGYYYSLGACDSDGNYARQLLWMGQLHMFVFPAGRWQKFCTVWIR